MQEEGTPKIEATLVSNIFITTDTRRHRFFRKGNHQGSSGPEKKGIQHSPDQAEWKIEKNKSNRSEITRTSQPSTPFMISFSRAKAACCLRYASRSPSARRSGTRWIRDQTFSRCSSLLRQIPSVKKISHQYTSYHVISWRRWRK